MPHNFACVVLRAEKIVAHFQRNIFAAVTHQAAERDGGIYFNRRQKFAAVKEIRLRARLRVQRINAAGHEMHEGVANAVLRKMKPIHRADDFAAGHEGDFDKIFETAAQDFDIRAVRLATQKRAILSFENRTRRAIETVSVALPAERHVEQPIRPKNQTVQAAIVVIAEAMEDHGAFVGAAIAVGVFERDQVRWIGDVKFSVAPRDAHRWNKILEINILALVFAVVIGIAQNADTAAARLLLQFGIQVAARRFGDKKAAIFSERAEHGEMNGAGHGDAFDFETIGHVKIWSGGENKIGARENNQDERLHGHQTNLIGAVFKLVCIAGVSNLAA